MVPPGFAGRWDWPGATGRRTWLNDYFTPLRIREYDPHAQEHTPNSRGEDGAATRTRRNADVDPAAAFGGGARSGEDVARLAQELHDSADLHEPGLSFVSEDDNRLVGHVMSTWCAIEEREERVLQLSPLGVLPSYQRRGHGSALVGASLEAVRARGEPLLILEGAPAYYTRFGFVRADEVGLLPPPETRYDWAFQVAVLERDAELPQGRVVYSEPFRH